MLVQEFRNSVLVAEYEVADPVEPEPDPQAARIAELEATVAALKDNATGKITKAQLAARLAAEASGARIKAE